MLERAEEIYHRMMLGEEGNTLESRWMQGVDRYLGSAVEEIPDAQKVWLASHMSIELPPEVYARADIAEWERLIGGKALEALRFEGPEKVLALLSEREDRSLESPLYSIEIRARMSLGELDSSQFDRAVEISRHAAAGWSMQNEGRLAEIIWLALRPPYARAVRNSLCRCLKI